MNPPGEVTLVAWGKAIWRSSMAVNLAGYSGLDRLAFYFSERSLRQWLGGKLDPDIDVLNSGRRF